VLFNTVAYAQFFALVFIVSWALVNRRWAALLPWFGLAFYVMYRPSWLGSGLTALALIISWLLCRKSADTQPVKPAVAATSVVVNYAALSLLTHRDLASDPFGAGLRALGIPLAADGFIGIAALAAAPLALFALVRAKKVRLLFILGASYVFYANWDWRYLPLIWASATADWLLGNAIARAADARRRKLWLVAAISMNLGVLAVFKYFDFGVASARGLLEGLGFHPPEVALRLALPIGISFFTFESMSYVIDIYRRHIEPHQSYVEYLSFVAYFPHLVAGPIVRPRDLLPQLAGEPRFNAQEGSEALFLIATGLLKKVAVGDYLALNLVDRVFDAPLQYSALECYVAVLGWAVQIYCDFSGYTDIAIGSALLLGVRFPLNFNAPYKAQDIVEFWRRWHISLSTWLRDYLYIPLGGNRKGPTHTYLNLMITMLLGGLWHGANWTFVAWGGLHGAALSVTRAFQGWRERSGGKPSNAPIFRVLRVILTFHLVCAAWIFFRAESFQHAALIFSQLASMTTFHGNLHPMVLAILAIGLVSHWAPEHWYLATRQAFTRMPALAQGAALFCVALTVREMASAEAVPFVYFQF